MIALKMLIVVSSTMMWVMNAHNRMAGSTRWARPSLDGTPSITAQGRFVHRAFVHP
jgi:hypothetical protein